MKRVGEIKPQHKDLQWFGYKVTFLVPTPLLESPTREFSSLCQQTPLWQRKPYTPIYTPQLRHNLITTSTQLLHTYLLHTYLLHTFLLHTYLLHFNQLHNKSISTFYTTSISSKLLITNTTQLHKYIYTMHNYSSMLLELSCRRSVLLLHFG